MNDDRVRELVSHVREMRELQRKYFAARSPDVLEACKKAERTVDEMVKQFFEPRLF